MKQRFMDYSLLMAIKKVGSDDDSVVNKRMDFEETCQVNDHTQIDDFAAHQQTFHQKQSIKDHQIKQTQEIYSRDGKWCYQISIIDYLQTFDSGKKQEVLAKKLFKRADPKKLSAVPPDPYGQRFIGFMKSSVFQRSQKFLAKEREQEQEEILKQIEEMQKKIRDEILGAFARAFTKKKTLVEDDSGSQKAETAIN